MHTRREALAAVAVAALGGCTRGGRTTSDDSRPTPAGTGSAGTDARTATGTLSVSTPAFEDGGTIPTKYTGAGEDVSPPITVGSVPSTAETLAIVVDDPDANNYVHWLVWNVPADTDEIPEGIPQQGTVPSLDGARQGTNDFGELGYRGPLPPRDDGAHTYRFTVSAVDTTLDLESGAGRGRLESALEGRVVATDRFTGEFDR